MECHNTQSTTEEAISTEEKLNDNPKPSCSGIP